MLSELIKARIRDEALAMPSQEVCGIVFEDDAIWPMLNASMSPETQWEFDGDEWEDAQISGIEKHGPIAAIYHSHVGITTAARLSSKDIANARELGIPFILYHTDFDEWDYWEPDGLNPYPLRPISYTPNQVEFYLGWPFEYGRCDCYTVFRNYYRGALGIVLNDFPRGNPKEVVDKKWDMYCAHFEAQGFRKLDRDESLQDNDVLMMCLQGAQVHHAAVLVDVNRNHAIHLTEEGRLSDRFIFDPRLPEYRFAIRHKKLEVAK